MENSTPQFISCDSRDYSRKIGIAEFINIKKAIQARKLLANRYWSDLARIS